MKLFILLCILAISLYSQCEKENKNIKYLNNNWKSFLEEANNNKNKEEKYINDLIFKKTNIDCFKNNKKKKENNLFF